MLAVLMSAVTARAGDAGTAIPIHLHAGNLATALRELSIATQTSIVFSPDTVAPFRAVGLNGEMTVDVALERLLAQSGLIYRRTDERTFIVFAKPLPSFDIPRQPLASAIRVFAAQAHVRVTFPADRIASKVSLLIAGRLSIRAALDLLLAGSGLRIAADDGHLIVLKPFHRSMTPRRVEGDAAPDAASHAEEIIVTGSPRAGALKRDSDTIIFALTELEMKRLPILDVSDALTRLPGVRRNDTQSGENRYVAIRGLNNAAASQSIDGVLLTNYINGSRATSTEALTSAFFRNTVVATTAAADLDENANASHVSLATISGLDGGGPHLFDARVMGGVASRANGIRGTHQPLRASATWRGALDSSGRIGLAIGVDIDRLGSRQDAKSVSGYAIENGNLVPNGAITNGETFAQTQRVGAMARLDFRPNDKLGIFAEYFYFAHDFITDQRTATLNVSAATATNVTASSGQFNSAAATYGFDHSASPMIRDHLFQLGADYSPGRKNTLSVRFGLTLNRVSQFGVSTNGFTSTGTMLTSPVRYSFSGSSLGFSPGISDMLANPASYALTGKVVVNNTVSKDENYFARLDYTHNLGPTDRGVGIKLGAQLKTLDRTNTQYGYARVLPPGASVDLAEATNASSVRMLTPVDWNQGAFLTLVNQRGIPSSDANSLYAADPANGYGQDFKGTEQIVDLYAIGSIATGRARVSAGFRAAYTHRKLNEYEPDLAGLWGPAKYHQAYWNLLPSAYGYYDLTNQLKIRGAFSNTLERPAINSSSRRVITNYDTPITRTTSYSNPYLLPIRSTNFDASLEYYYGSHTAYLSVGLFSKYLRNIPAVSGTETVDSSGVREIVSYTSNVTQVNGKKVYSWARGIELMWSDPALQFFPKRLGNLGVVISYAYIPYLTTVINGGGGVPATATNLVDVSQRNYFNAALYYKNGPFAANLFVEKQSSIPTMTYVVANDRRTSYWPLMDFQASDALTPNIRIMIEGRNILDQAIVDRYGITNYQPAYQTRHNGRTLWFGVQVTAF